MEDEERPTETVNAGDDGDAAAEMRKIMNYPLVKVSSIPSYSRSLTSFFHTIFFFEFSRCILPICLLFCLLMILFLICAIFTCSSSIVIWAKK